MTVALLLAFALFQDADVKGELDALESGFKKAQDEYWAAMRAAKTPEERAKVEHPVPKFVAKYRDVAKRAEGTEHAAVAHGWIFKLSAQKKDAATMREAADKLLASHAESPVIGECADWLWWGHAWAKDWLRACAAKATVADSKCAILFRLGIVLIRETGATDAQKAEGRKLLAAVAKDFPASPRAKEASAVLFEMEHLQIGCEAPDFEATDVDGQAFKLSDYRGKVVVVDFWGFW